MGYVFVGLSPASRLEELFVQLDKTPNGGILAAALGTMFDADPNTAKFASAHASILGLIELCRIGIATIPDGNAARYGPIFDQAASLFTFAELGNPVSHTQTRIRQGNLIVLIGLCAQAFEKHGRADAVHKDTLHEWMATASRLLSEITADSALSDDNREYLKTLLLSLISSLSSNQVAGARHLREHIDLLIIQLVRLQSGLPKESGGRIREVIGEIAQTLANIDGVLTTAISLYEKGAAYALPAVIAVGGLLSTKLSN